MRLISLLIVLFLSPAFLAAGDVRPVHRFGLFVGANEGKSTQPHLRWAIADAQKMAAIMVETGGIERADATVLGQPTAGDLLGKLRSLRTLIRDTKLKQQKVEFYFYYSGHSDEKGLLVGTERVLYSDLRAAITNTEADVNVAILDSCDSGAFTRAKGGERVQPFLSDLSTETTGYAFLTSSSETEASQESDQLGGSFFTYYLINGLRGAADTTGDRRVTLNQAYQYAFRETLAQTEGTSTGAQHASYDFQLKGSGDLVIVDLTTHRSSVLLDKALAGRFFIRDQRGALISELQKESGAALTIAIPIGSYAIRYQQSGILRTARIIVTADEPSLVSNENFVSETAAVNRLRGDSGEVGRRFRAFDLQIFPGLDAPPEEDTGVSLGVLGTRVDAVRSLQASGLVAITQKSVSGTQAGGVFAQSETVNGVQAAGVLAIGDVNGLQSAGVISFAQSITGVQSSGVLNVAGTVRGAQFSVVNVATNVHGIQVGVFNYADDVDGLSIGVFSWITHGIHELSLGYDTSTNGPFVRWTGGSRFFWTSLECGVQLDRTLTLGNHSVNGMWFDTSVGLRFATGLVDFDLGAGLKRLGFHGVDPIGEFISIWTEGSLQMIPHVDASLRLNLGKRFALWAGPHLDFIDSRLVSLDRYNNAGSIQVYDVWGSVTSLRLGFSAGLTFKL